MDDEATALSGEPRRPALAGLHVRRRWLLAGGLATASACALGSCLAWRNGSAAGSGLPEAAPLLLPPAGPEAPRTAWVFSSGGPRGFLHIGVLKGLSALGLRPDLVVGSSVGALAGTLFAAGVEATRIETLALSVQPWDLLRLNLRGPGWVSGGGIAELVRESLGGRPLQELPVYQAVSAAEE